MTADSKAGDWEVYSVAEIERIARVAGNMARELAISQGWERPRVISVDKANVLASSRLWKRVVSSVMETDFSDVELEHVYVDAAAMHMVNDHFI